MTDRIVRCFLPASSKAPSATDTARPATDGPGRRALLRNAVNLFPMLWLAYRSQSAVALSGSAFEYEGDATTVTIVEFSPSGKRLGKVPLSRVVKADDEWRGRLSPVSFHVARQAGTERAFSGDTWDEHRRGLFRCICCDTALFDSKTKFDSGTGWPSFWEPLARENIKEISDNSLGVTRVAVSCRRCDAHLGHVFDDGPRPTGLRYCMNSASLRFVLLA